MQRKSRELSRLHKNTIKEINVMCILTVDKCAPVRYNTRKFSKEENMMTGTYVTMNGMSNCCTTSAVGTSSARILNIMGTALLAVSILIIRLLLL